MIWQVPHEAWTLQGRPWRKPGEPFGCPLSQSNVPSSSGTLCYLCGKRHTPSLDVCSRHTGREWLASPPDCLWEQGLKHCTHQKAVPLVNTRSARLCSTWCTQRIRRNAAAGMSTSFEGRMGHNYTGDSCDTGGTLSRFRFSLWVFEPKCGSRSCGEWSRSVTLGPLVSFFYLELWSQGWPLMIFGLFWEILMGSLLWIHRWHWPFCASKSFPGWHFCLSGVARTACGLAWVLRACFVGVLWLVLPVSGFLLRLQQIGKRLKFWRPAYEAAIKLNIKTSKNRLWS